MKCPRCQHENPPQAKFCLECGARQALTCSKCRAELPGSAKFCLECGESVGPQIQTRSPDSYTPKHLAEKILTSKGALEGERKQVTVLFADLKGSMELLADRDPEEARKLLDPVLEHMMEAVHRYEGTVNQVMGDGIMALFGAPLAHEDHAVRACYAALRMQESVGRYAEGIRRSKGVPIRIRVGLNSGEVVVRSIGSDLHMDYTAVGQTTHLAARMEQMADPGAIVITTATLHLVEGYVEVKSIGPVPVKGLPDPVEIYEVTGAGQARSRLQAGARRGLTRFVGRNAELEQLRHALDFADAGRGQVVALVGEAGVGKSRVVHEFTHSHRLHGWLVLETASVSYGAATSYLPLIDLLKGYFQIHDRDDLRRIREKVIGKLLALDESLKATLPALLALFDAPVDDTGWQGLDPGQRRQRTLEALKGLLLREAREQPLVLVFEDLHWIDAETQALLDGLVDSLSSARLLLLVNYRPEYQHPWGGKTYYGQVRLDALPAESAGELLDGLLGDDPGLAPLKQLLVKRGNPFFLEETVRTLVETKALAGERGRYRLTQPVQALQVPPSVQAMLAARIDRLPMEDKRLLQTASVIGKAVPFALLQTIADLPDEALRGGLDRLRAAEFLYETRLFPDLEYSFTHALTHEVTYGSLLQERRRELHARIVEAIETLHRDRLGEQIERLAHHALRGELWNHAVTYLRQAGRRSMARALYREAADHFEQALDALRYFPEARETIELGIDLRFDFRSALFPLGDSERMLRLVREADTLAAGLGDQRRLAQASNYMAVQSFFLQRYDEAISFGRRALAIGEQLNDPWIEAPARAYLGIVHAGVGDFAQAIPLTQRNVDRLQGDLLYERFGQANVISAHSRVTLAVCLAELGQFAEAILHLEEAVRIAEEPVGRYTLTYALRELGFTRLARGDRSGAIAPLARAVEISRTSEFTLLIPGAMGALGHALSLDGRPDEALELLDLAAVALSSPKFALFPEQHLAYLGAAYLLAGRLDAATTWARIALEASQRRGAHRAEAYALKTLGDISTHPDRFDPEYALVHYRQALALAERLTMRPLIAHCHVGLGTIYRHTDKRQEAQERLTIAITMYREMDMLFWLDQADQEMTRLR